ncbi:unnamed protein product [Prorocentrum cordatum]|uniref:RRM domain-containing protein n=1 Tax=Prorocentrum cordatum TaxID=2364126 RepID=A0ABN9Y2L6_9DINO|nr:unnamed protein product [Polarella glacialis]
MGMPGELRRGSAGGAGAPPGHNYPDASSSQGPAGIGGQPGNSPWVMPGAMPSAQALQGAMGASGGGRNKGKDSGATKKSEGTTEQKGRVPLSGGGPKRTDYIKKYGGGEGAECSDEQPKEGKVPITTMMLKNIPCRKSQEEVAMHIDQKGFSGRYDFFYLPRDVKFRANLGYAFINFLTPEDASQFEQEMNGYRFNGSGSTKACGERRCASEGLVNNLAAFKRTEVMRSSRKPYFAGEGKE